METTTTTQTKGGKRIGAGRPKGDPKQLLTMSISTSIIQKFGDKNKLKEFINQKIKDHGTDINASC